MWTCPKCGRVFKRTGQQHSCQRVSLDRHFAGKEKARELFEFLVVRIEAEVGKCKVVSIPCCIHLFGTYDFLAALPKKDRLEIRFALDRKIESPRLKVCVPMSAKVYKNCFDVSRKEEIDEEFLGWLAQSYYLKSGKI